MQVPPEAIEASSKMIQSRAERSEQSQAGESVPYSTRIQIDRSCQALPFVAE